MIFGAFVDVISSEVEFEIKIASWRKTSSDISCEKGEGKKTGYSWAR